MRKYLILIPAVLIMAAGCRLLDSAAETGDAPEGPVRVYNSELHQLIHVSAVSMTDDEWRNRLDDKRYKILRKAGTERPFTSSLLEIKEKGVFLCAGCKNELFSSDAKYDSGTGWPSFYRPVHEANVILKQDLKYGMVRTEVICSRCRSHLGHVFDDGPDPTGKRYCINGLALDFNSHDE